MKTILATLTFVALASFLFEACLVVANFVDPCPKKEVGYQICNANLPADNVERYCSSSVASVSQAECEKSVQEVAQQPIPSQSVDSTSETFTGTDVDRTQVKCQTATSCQWKDNHCMTEGAVFTYPLTAVLYRTKYCLTGEPVPQN
jgi:hypothetical protein